MVAKRAALGVGKTGGLGRNSSGDIFLAFSTISPNDNEKGTMQFWKVLSKEMLDKVYQATIQATEEAIINALVASKTMGGINDNLIYGIPHDKMMQVINNYSHQEKKK